MIELRWVGKELQMRQAIGIDASGAFCPGAVGEWETVANSEPTETKPVDERDVDSDSPMEPEKARRIGLQSQLYAAMRLVDLINGNDVVKGSGVTEDDMLTQVDDAIERVKAMRTPGR